MDSNVPEDNLRKRIKDKLSSDFKIEMEKRSWWFPFSALILAILGLLVVLNAIFAPLYAKKFWIG